MGSELNIQDRLQAIEKAAHGFAGPLERFRHEIEFAGRMADALPEHGDEWRQLTASALSLVLERLKAGGAVDPGALVAEAEALLTPIGEAAKQYTIHCVGHAHIDMNWMWSWPETVSVTHDTFSTMDRLMDEFPDFKFSQSQASVYHAMEKHSPEVFERIRRRVAEGRWEVTASMWVEGDKNLASGEILARHLLYTRRWFKETFDLPYDAVKMDWECDTFGHAHTLPGILRRGGVGRYYFHRAGAGHRLFWWQGKDGSRVLAFDDGRNGYNGEIAPRMTHLLFDFEKRTGLKDMMWVYGVGDHGGGPTRRHLRAAADMNGWPIWPNIKLTTTDEYFALAEREAKDLPVVDAELNYVFRGCYTSESNIKFANRTSENALVEAEAAAVLAAALTGQQYPDEPLEEAWRDAMFNQFHDILPGSGVRETYQYAQGLFQELLACTNSIRTRSLRRIAAAVDTASLASADEAGAAQGMGAGVGEGAWWGGISSLGAGAGDVDPFVVFNPSPWSRTEVVTAKVWDHELPDDRTVVRAPDGDPVRAQVLEKGHYWGHHFTTVAFPARDLPPMGYRAYVVAPSPKPAPGGAAGVAGANTLENEFLEVEVEPGSGAIVRLVDKQSGYNFVPEGKRLGLLQLLTEAPHGMTAWEIGQIVRQRDFTEGGVLNVAHRGPNVASLRCAHTHNDSSFAVTISLQAGVPRVDFALDVNWLERGSPELGVPMLKVAFPLAVAEGRATFEVPFGYVERPTDGEEVPALMWADLSGAAIGVREASPVGATLLNDSKYGHNVTQDTIRLTLLRSSYDPDPLPELGRHEIRFALMPHVGDWRPSAATRAGQAFNHPFSIVGAELHEGTLPSACGFVTVEPENVFLSALKKAEDSDALILRLYELEGRETEARVKLAKEIVPQDSACVETDLLEQPLAESTAGMEGDTLTVTVPAYGIATVRVGG